MKPFDTSGAFQPVADGDGLRRLAVRGAGVTVLSQSLGFATQMIATVVLARLLSPEDFGLVTMVTTFSLLLMNFGLNGFTEAVLQREEMNHSLASNLFWINTGLSLLLAIGFAAVGPVLARFYGDPRVAGVTVAIASTILFTGLSVQHLALLKRAMRFSDVSTNDILARVVAVAVSIFFASAGWGYWALVAGTVALPLATFAGAWTLCRWVPGLPRRGVGTSPMVWFAMNTYGRFTVNYFTRNLDNLLVGWHFGPQLLGFYKKAYDLFVLPGNQLSAPLTAVAVSTLSRLTRDSSRQGRYFLSALSTVGFIGMGLGATLTLIGEDLVVLLLGPGWEESGRIFTFFAPGIGMMLLYGTHGWIHLSIGRADRWFRWGLVEFSLTGLLFLAGLRWGPAGIAAAWVVSVWVLTIPALWYAGRPARLRTAQLIGATWKYVLASAVAACASAVIIRLIPYWAGASGPMGAIGRILVTSSLFGAFYLSAVVLLHRGFAPIRHIAGLLHDMVPAGRFSRSSHQGAPTAPHTHQHESCPVSYHAATKEAAVDQTGKRSMMLSAPERDKREHITVCICTYKRPGLLQRLLQTVSQQRTDGLFDHSIVIVDNDCTESAKGVVLSLRDRCRLTMEYYCEPEQNIALARNKAIEHARGDLIAFIDDDELPQEDWLLALYHTYRRFRVDGVLGPVRPHFPVDPPRWIAKGRFFDRDSFTTGSFVKDSRQMRTGNVLLRRNLVNEAEAPFDRYLGRTGGEDTDFFRRRLERGNTFVWCDEAVAYETVPIERLTRTYLLRRALLHGVSEARRGNWGALNLGRSIIAVLLYTSILPMLLVTSHHSFMKFLIKNCDHLGKLLAVCGLELVKERTT